MNLYHELSDKTICPLIKEKEPFYADGALEKIYIDNKIDESITWLIEDIKSKEILSYISIHKVKNSEIIPISFATIPSINRIEDIKAAINLVRRFVYRRYGKNLKALVDHDNNFSRNLLVQCGFKQQSSTGGQYVFLSEFEKPDQFKIRNLRR